MFIEGELSEQDQLVLMFRAIESVQNGVVITDPNKSDNPIIYTNRAFSDITGYTAEEILGRNCRFLQKDDREQEAINEIKRALREVTAVTVILRNYKKDGERFYNELTISPVHSKQGKLLAFVGIQNDITKRIEAEQRISDFYSIVSHELRSPIAKIKSSLSVITDGEAGTVNDTAMRFIEISTRAAESLWKLIENILDFKKLESGKFRLLRQRVSLVELVENAVTDFKPVAEQAGITLSFQNTEHPIVYADTQRILQVIENLLSNAVKFSPPNSAITISVSKVKNRARVGIQDEGPGISAHDQTRLFEKFQQLDSPDRRMRGGSGLGLSICKEIVEAHEGFIGVDSHPGSGASFWFELPGG